MRSYWSEVNCAFVCMNWSYSLVYVWFLACMRIPWSALATACRIKLISFVGLLRDAKVVVWENGWRNEFLVKTSEKFSCCGCCKIFVVGWWNSKWVSSEGRFIENTYLLRWVPQCLTSEQRVEPVGVGSVFLTRCHPLVTASGQLTSDKMGTWVVCKNVGEVDFLAPFTSSRPSGGRRFLMTWKAMHGHLWWQSEVKSQVTSDSVRLNWLPRSHAHTAPGRPSWSQAKIPLSFF